MNRPGGFCFLYLLPHCIWRFWGCDRDHDDNYDDDIPGIQEFSVFVKEYETLSTVRSKVDVYLDEVHVGCAILEPMGEASRFCGSWVDRYRYYPFIFVY